MRWLGVYKDLETPEAERKIYRIAKARDKSAKDFTQITQIKDDLGVVLWEHDKIIERWKDYYGALVLPWSLTSVHPLQLNTVLPFLSAQGMVHPRCPTVFNSYSRNRSDACWPHVSWPQLSFSAPSFLSTGCEFFFPKSSDRVII